MGKFLNTSTFHFLCLQNAPRLPTGECLEVCERAYKAPTNESDTGSQLMDPLLLLQLPPPPCIDRSQGWRCYGPVKAMHLNTSRVRVFNLE